MPVKVRDIHAQSLENSSALSAYYIPDFIPPLDVIRVLNAAKLRFMLVGTHALGGWMREPRTTTDIDILIGQRFHSRAVRLLLRAFPQLRVEDREEESHLGMSRRGRF